jgi:hypothetical protein
LANGGDPPLAKSAGMRPLNAQRRGEPRAATRQFVPNQANRYQAWWAALPPREKGRPGPPRSFRRPGRCIRPINLPWRGIREGRPDPAGIIRNCDGSMILFPIRPGPAAGPPRRPAQPQSARLARGTAARAKPMFFNPPLAVSDPARRARRRARSSGPSVEPHRPRSRFQSAGGSGRRTECRSPVE